MSTVPEFELNNGVRIPAIGLGVFQSPPAETSDAVATALRLGYRHIDTAASYLNEREVGEGIRRSGLARDEIFVETKIWVTDYGTEETLRGFEKASAKLGLEQLDLLILHQPAVGAFDRTIAAYRALEKLYAHGRVRAIGVSNFTPIWLPRLLDEIEVIPAVNQIELHPYYVRRDAQDANAAHGILTQAWSPIGGITAYGGGGTTTFTEPVLLDIGAAHAKSPAQVMLRWHIQQGRQVIPKSTNPTRIAENFDVFDFDLTADELARIDRLDTGVGGGPDQDKPHPEFFQFQIPDA